METTGYAQGYVDSPSAVREDETFTRGVQERLKGLQLTVNEAHADLSMLMERTFGGATTSQGVDQKADQPSAGRAGDIMAQLDRLQQLAGRVASQARHLNTRV